MKNAKGKAKAIVAGVMAATGIVSADAAASVVLPTAPITGDASNAQPVQVGTVNKYLAASKVPTQLQDDNGNTYTIGNKRALAVAMYLLCCEKLGVAPSSKNVHALALSARLLPLCGCGYSKHKGDALKGGEVRSNGMKGYADFATKHKDAVKLMPSGERYVHTQSAMPLARATFALYANVEGYAAYCLATGHKVEVQTPSVQDTPAPAPLTDATMQG